MARKCSVPEAASLLGVGSQRVHQRIRDGSLPAEKIGGRYVIDLLDVLALRGKRAAGRPYSPRSAWSLIAVDAEHPSASELDPPARSRAAARLRVLRSDAADFQMNEAVDEIRESLSRALSRLAARQAFRASPRDLPDLRSDPRVVLAGVSHPAANLSAANFVEAYIRPEVVDDVVEDYLLSGSSPREANVVLHVVEAQNAVVELADQSLLVLAADLMQHEGPREQGEALRVLGDWLREVGHG